MPSSRKQQVDNRIVSQKPVDWAGVELPDAWPDRINWFHPQSFLLMLAKFAGRARTRVILPDGLPGRERIPAYVLQEFHNLPNGNYSKRFSQGYARGFEPMMLGTLRQGRERLANALAGAESVVDLGCGSGGCIPYLKAVGINVIWGLDPSPYLLQLAARQYSGAYLLHGIGEEIPLQDNGVDGVNVCFVFHEIPPAYLQCVLAEIKRILKPGGRIAILEPASTQWSSSVRQLWRNYGWRGLYFKWLARHAFEPFVPAWHKLDFPALLREAGFDVLEDDTGCPFRFIVAQRSIDATA
jgi:ubiquinone/menaquinone biosynthesis C-methylase UbiE